MTYFTRNNHNLIRHKKYKHGPNWCNTDAQFMRHFTVERTFWVDILLNSMKFRRNVSKKLYPDVDLKKNWKLRQPDHGFRHLRGDPLKHEYLRNHLSSKHPNSRRLQSARPRWRPRGFQVMHPARTSPRRIWWTIYTSPHPSSAQHEQYVKTNHWRRNPLFITETSPYKNYPKFAPNI